MHRKRQVQCQTLDKLIGYIRQLFFSRTDTRMKMQVTCRFGQRREHNVDNESYMHILSHIEFENRLRKSTQIRQEALDSKKIESTLL